MEMIQIADIFYLIGSNSSKLKKSNLLIPDNPQLRGLLGVGKYQLLGSVIMNRV